MWADCVEMALALVLVLILWAWDYSYLHKHCIYNDTDIVEWEHSETADLRQGESGPYPESGSRWLPKFRGKS